MRLPLRLAYDAAAHLAQAAARLAPSSDSKVLTALAARRGLLERYRAWASVHRDTTRPLLWMHAPSVGEGLQARPVLELMRQRRPDAQLAYTHFSPSALKLAASLDVDYHDYLVLDTPHDADAAMDALRPAALVFSKLDVWPNLVDAARRRNVKLGLVSGTLSVKSSRRSTVARALLSDAYAALDAVGAIDAADAQRLVELGVRQGVVEVTGDVRYDQVWTRAQAVDRTRGPVATLSGRPTLVAGSTWPADEAVLLPAFAQLRRSSPDLRLIVAPHEPTPAHVNPILAWARAEQIPVAKLSDADCTSADLVVVDSVGVLGDLYALATIAFVGGGFHAAGLHSVVEPAAFGSPVLFGPGHAMSRDAGLLIASGGAMSIADEREAVATINGWLNPDRRAEASAAALGVVQRGLGAAERSFRIVDRLLR